MNGRERDALDQLARYDAAMRQRLGSDIGHLFSLPTVDAHLARLRNLLDATLRGDPFAAAEAQELTYRLSAPEQDTVTKELPEAFSPRIHGIDRYSA